MDIILSLNPQNTFLQLISAQPDQNPNFDFETQIVANKPVQMTFPQEIQTFFESSDHIEGGKKEFFMFRSTQMSTNVLMMMKKFHFFLFLCLFEGTRKEEKFL